MLYPIKLKENITAPESERMAKEETKKQDIRKGDTFSILIEQPEVTDLFMGYRHYKGRITIRRCTDQEWNTFFNEVINAPNPVKKKTKGKTRSIINW